MENTSIMELDKKWALFLSLINSQFPKSKDKVDALEDYLACFINSLSDNDISPRQHFRDCIGAAGILTRCFLDDVAQLCQNSSSETQRSLLNYLYDGRGSRLMRTLERIGVGGITCNFELTELLLSLLPYLRSQTLINEVAQNGLSWSTSRYKNELNNVMVSDCVAISCAKESSVAEKCSSSTIQLSDLERMENPRFKILPNSNIALDSIFNLLQQLCEADVEDCSSMPFSNNASATVLSVLTEQLLVIEDDEVHKNISLPHSYIIQKMISLIVGIGASLLKYKDPLNRLSCISSSLFQFLSCRLKELASRTEFEEDKDEIYYDEILICTEGIVNILHFSSNVNNSVVEYGDFLQIFQLFLSEDVYQIVYDSICYLMKHAQKSGRNEAITHLIISLGQIGMSVKKLRLEARQSRFKDRNATKRWRLDVTSHHHYQLEEKSSCCPVDIVSRLLMSLVNFNDNSADEVMKSTVLNALAKCGICCCASLDHVYSVMLTNFLQISSNLQEQRLRFIEYSVISLSGCQILFERTVVTCESCKTRIHQTDQTLEEMYSTSTNSKFLEVLYLNPSFLNGYWKVFENYRNIISSASSSLILIVEKHLLSIVTGIYRKAVQLELFLRLVLPLLVHHSGSYEDEDDTTILRSMLNIVVVFADVPEVNCILHKINIMENLYRVMCLPKLRDVVLRLLHTLAMVSWIKNIDSIAIQNEKDDVGDTKETDNMRAVLNIYQEILVQHTICYQKKLGKCTEEEEQQQSIDSDSVHMESDGQLLLCLRDLWKTMSCISDKCAEHRQWLWGKSLKDLVTNFTKVLARRNYIAFDDSFDEVEWEILGILIHLIVTCEDFDNSLPSNYDNKSILEDLKLIFNCFLDVETFYPTVNRLFRMLSLASLETNRFTLEYKKTFSNLNSKRLSETGDNFSGSDVEVGSMESSSFAPYLSSHECDYDADIEDNDTCWQRGEFPMAKLYKCEPWLEDLNKITCPTVLNLALELATEYKNYLNSVNRRETALLTPIENFFQTLNSICKSSASNCQILLKSCNIPTFILNNFVDVLINEDISNYLPLQSALLDLLSSSVRYTMLDWELRKFLKIFMKNPKLSPNLLQCLNSILNTVRAEPPTYITFLNTTTKKVEYDDPHDGTDVSILQSIVGHRQEHFNYSSFAVASIMGFFPSFALDDFPFGDCGLGVSLWIYLPEDHYTRKYGTPIVQASRNIHLFTCTYNHIAIEFWIHIDTKLLVLKLTHWSKNVYEILDTKLSTNPLTVNDWRHLFVNWVPFRKGKNLIILVYVSENASINGILPEKFTLECEWHYASKKRRNWELLLGHSEFQEEHGETWRLGQLKVFRGSFLNNEAASLLHKIGSDNTQLHFLQNIKVEKSMSLPTLNQLDIYNLVNLKKKQLISYLSQNADVFIMHGGNEFSRSSSMSAESYIKAIKLGNFKSSPSTSLHVTLTRVGGAPIFISLFGLIVANFSNDEVIQADCLQLLSDLLKRDEKILKHFLECSGWELILCVMSTSKCKISCRMLALLLKECTSDSVLIYNLSDQKWAINKGSTATVVNPKLLSLLLYNWKMWNDGCKENLHWLLRCCLFLVDGCNPKREVNLKIFVELNVFDIILDLLRERCFGDNQSTLSNSSCRCIVRLFEVLCVRKNTLNCLTKLMDCLIAIHPFNLTYISHARSSFYFLMDAPANKNGNLKSFKGFSSSKREKGLANDFLKHFRELSSTATIPSTSRTFSNEIHELSEDRQQLNTNQLLPSSNVEDNYIEVVSIASFKTCDNDHIPPPLESSTEICLESSQKVNVSDETKQGPIHSIEESTSKLIEETIEPPPSQHSQKLSSYENKSSQYSNYFQLLKDIKQKSNNSEDISSSVDIGVVAKGILSIIARFFEETDPISFLEIAKIIDYKILIVLALHPFEGVRTEIVKIFRIYLKKIKDDRGFDVFKKPNLYTALANQLYQFKSDTALVEACLEFTLGELFSFQTSNKIVPSHFKITQPLGIPLLLSILPRLNHNSDLCQNFVIFLSRLCQSQFDLYYQFFDHGLVQSVCLTISSVVHLETSPFNFEENSKSNSILDCLNDFLSDAVYYYLWFGNTNQVEKIFEVLHLISYYEDLEILRFGIGLRSHLAFRNCICECLLTALTTLLVHFEWSEETIEYCCKHEYLSRTMARSYPLPSKMPTDIELQYRFGEIMGFAVNHLLSASEIDGCANNVSTKEEWFGRFTLHILLDGCLTSLSPVRWSFQSQWTILANSMRQHFSCNFLRLLSYLLSPIQPFAQRIKIIEHLNLTQNHVDTLLWFLKDDANCRQQAINYLEALLKEDVDILTNDEIAKCVTLLIELQKECSYLLNVTEVSKNKKSDNKWVHSTKGMQNYLQKLEARFEEVVKIADQATAIITEKQEEQMKRFHLYMKKKFHERLFIRQKWQSIVNRLTHERAIWHHAESWSSSWQLDSTEGPQRVRKRLKSCSLIMEERFLLAKSRNKLEAANSIHPFKLLFENENASDDRAVISNNIQTKEKISFISSCSIITPAIESGGDLLFGTNCIYYIGEEKNPLSYSKFPSKSDVICHSWKFIEVTEIHKRRFQLQDSALEIFLSNGQTYLLAFNSTKERNEIYERVMTFELPNLVPDNDNLEIQTQMWREGGITNFEYLTQLNKFAGRTFNDLMQYPVFPFILADYDSLILDLNDIETFRNLTKPMAIQKKNRESHYLKQYNFLQKEQETGGSSLDPTVTPYHYGSHYSNSGIVLHFLVRLPPFTNMFLHYQDNNFDIPDRTFHCVQTSWRLASSDSTTDVKELIPEFYFLPEMFVNGEGYDFGVRQTGEPVNDVELPTWCRQNPRLFTLIHRQALESNYVTENLHHWIDLVFGYKQTGKAAVEAMNVFHPATYYGFDIKQMTDPLRLDAMKTMIKTFGQTPVQLFRRSHPLVALSLTEHSSCCTKRVMDEVDGLNWGKYVGSPSETEPTEVLRKRQSQQIRSFVSVVTNEVFGLSAKTALLVQYCKDKGISVLNTTYITSAALIRWSHDGLVWIQMRRDHLARPFAAVDIGNPITCCGTTPDCKFIFFGRSSGNIIVYHTFFEPPTIGTQGIVKWNKITHLYGHDSEVTKIYLCKEFSVAVSASTDTNCIIWDMNRYVRSITDHQHSVELICVSCTSGDIASVSHLSDKSSVLMLHTINASLIEKVTTMEKIHSICFSTATEGISVNVVCGGLGNGSIMMWNSWDLLPVRIIKIPRFNIPVISLSFSLDCKHLYISNEEGDLVILESSSFSNQVPKFRIIF